MIENVKVIRTLQRLITNFWNTNVRALVWIDPLETISNFKESMRGTGYYFEESALVEFLEKPDTVRMIRAHQYVPASQITMFSDHLITVFSASNDCGQCKNEATVLALSPKGEDELKTFPPLKFIPRETVQIRVLQSDLVPEIVRKRILG
jgi:hypothetical protein